MDNKLGTFYICGVDIGNKKDIPQRLVDLFNKTKYIVVEDRNSFNERFTIKDHIVLDYKTGDWPNEVFLKSYEVKNILSSGNDVLYIAKNGMPKTDQPAGNLITRMKTEDMSVVMIPGPDEPSSVMALSGLGYGNGFFYLNILDYRKQEILDTLKISSKLKESTIIKSRYKNINELLNLLVESGYDINTHAAFICNLGIENEIVSNGPIKYMQEFFLKTSKFSDFVFLIIGGNNPPPVLNENYLKNNEGFSDKYIDHRK